MLKLNAQNYEEHTRMSFKLENDADRFEGRMSRKYWTRTLTCKLFEETQNNAVLHQAEEYVTEVLRFLEFYLWSV